MCRATTEIMALLRYFGVYKLYAILLDNSKRIHYQHTTAYNKQMSRSTTPKAASSKRPIQVAASPRSVERPLNIQKRVHRSATPGESPEEIDPRDAQIAALTAENYQLQLERASLLTSTSARSQRVLPVANEYMMPGNYIPVSADSTEPMALTSAYINILLSATSKLNKPIDHELHRLDSLLTPSIDLLENDSIALSESEFQVIKALSAITKRVRQIAHRNFSTSSIAPVEVVQSLGEGDVVQSVEEGNVSEVMIPVPIAPVSSGSPAGDGGPASLDTALISKGLDTRTKRADKIKGFFEIFKTQFPKATLSRWTAKAKENALRSQTRIAFTASVLQPEFEGFSSDELKGFFFELLQRFKTFKDQESRLQQSRAQQ